MFSRIRPHKSEKAFAAGFESRSSCDIMRLSDCFRTGWRSEGRARDLFPREGRLFRRHSPVSRRIKTRSSSNRGTMPHFVGQAEKPVVGGPACPKKMWSDNVAAFFSENRGFRFYLEQCTVLRPSTPLQFSPPRAGRYRSLACHHKRKTQNVKGVCSAPADEPVVVAGHEIVVNPPRLL